MSEQHISGGKQFLIVLGVSAVLYIIGAMIMSLFGDYVFVGGIIAVFIFCVFGLHVVIK